MKSEQSIPSLTADFDFTGAKEIEVALSKVDELWLYRRETLTEEFVRSTRSLWPNIDLLSDSAFQFTSITKTYATLAGNIYRINRTYTTKK